MTLIQTAPPDDGSVALTYSCPDCGYEFAMLTNRFETEVVGSLGVKLGSQDASGEGAEGTAESRCPFSGMVQQMQQPQAESAGFPWTHEAVSRLATIPEFVRPMARTGIEKYARDHGYPEVNDDVLDEAKHYFGM
jgi:hypothetical protein